MAAELFQSEFDITFRRISIELRHFAEMPSYASRHSFTDRWLARASADQAIWRARHYRF